MSTTTPQYTPGDTVNGHTLTAEGVWEPVTAHIAPKKNRKGLKIAAAVIAGMALFGAVLGATGNTVEDTPKEQTSVSAPAEVTEKPAEKPVAETKPVEETADLTVAQENAVDSAESYLRMTSFSKESLIDQLEYEGFSTADAKVAVEHLEDTGAVNWNEEALEAAESYLDLTGFSEEGLADQLEYEGFTDKQIAYALDNVDADYYAEAVESAESYMDLTSFSRSGLIDQLEYEGYTADQAAKAADAVGL